MPENIRHSELQVEVKLTIQTEWGIISSETMLVKKVKRLKREIRNEFIQADFCDSL